LESAFQQPAEALDFEPGAEPAAVLDNLRRTGPAVFAALREIVAGAYYLDPTVAARIGYHGRAAVPVTEDDTAELRRPVTARGPIYRPDPRG
jgi:hypothetical protein